MVIMLQNFAKSAGLLGFLSTVWHYSYDRVKYKWTKSKFVTAIKDNINGICWIAFKENNDEWQWLHHVVYDHFVSTLKDEMASQKTCMQAHQREDELWRLAFNAPYCNITQVILYLYFRCIWYCTIRYTKALLLSRLGWWKLILGLQNQPGL